MYLKVGLQIRLIADYIPECKNMFKNQSNISRRLVLIPIIQQIYYYIIRKLY